MKPPLRVRNKPVRCFETQQVASQRAGKEATSWRAGEQSNLLKGLKTLKLNITGTGDIDYSYLKTCVPTRSVSQIQSMVERLKKQVTANATTQLRKKMLEEKKRRKPIDEWIYLASAVTGSHEATISNAFLQMLTVSSTEPCSLANSIPSIVFRKTTDVRPSRHTLTPLPKAASQAKQPEGRADVPHLTKTPMGAAQKVSGPSQVIQVAVTSPAPPTLTISAPASRASKTQLSSATTTPVPSPSTVASTSASSSSLPTTPTCPPVTTATTVPSQTDQSSKCSTVKAPNAVGDRTVDFEKIYCYLSTIQKSSKKYQLTPMESAVVLDLLMSLPEELPLLDCNGLHKHLSKVFQCFSAPASSKMAKQMMKELRDEHSAQAEAQTPQNPGSMQRPAEKAASIHPEDGLNVPLLNPFMVPLKLLQRK